MYWNWNRETRNKQRVKSEEKKKCVFVCIASFFKKIAHSHARSFARSFHSGSNHHIKRLPCAYKYVLYCIIELVCFWFLFFSSRSLHTLSAVRLHCCNEINCMSWIYYLKTLNELDMERSRVLESSSSIIRVCKNMPDLFNKTAPHKCLALWFHYEHQCHRPAWMRAQIIYNWKYFN